MGDPCNGIRDGGIDSVTSATATPKRRRAAKPAEAVETQAPPVEPIEAAAPESDTPDASDSDDAPETAESRALAAQQATRALTIPGISAQFHERSLALPEKLTIKGWLKIVEAIDTVREGARWWFGDAIIAGETRWGETYSQALDANKYDYATLRNLRSVSKRYAPAERIYDLSWSHYNAAMGVPLDVARGILAEAFANDWSVAQVREYIKEIKSREATNGTTADIVKPVAPSLPRTEDLPGIKPLTAEQVATIEASGRTVEMCGGCDNVFAERVWHCVGCSGHWSLSVDECPNERCGVVTDDTDVPAPEAATPTPSTPTVAGTVITATENGADQALTVLMSFPFADLDPSDIAASLMSSDVYHDPVAILMSVHHWLGQVIDAASSDDDEPEAPGRDDEIESEEAEGVDAPDDGEDGLGDIFTAEDDEDQDADDENASDIGMHPSSPVTASQAAPAPTPAVSKPLSPAPKPGSGKPVRRRATAVN
jgi:hypothetical protein